MLFKTGFPNIIHHSLSVCELCVVKTELLNLDQIHLPIFRRVVLISHRDPPSEPGALRSISIFATSGDDVSQVVLSLEEETDTIAHGEVAIDVDLGPASLTVHLANDLGALAVCCFCAFSFLSLDELILDLLLRFPLLIFFIQIFVYFKSS